MAEKTRFEGLTLAVDDVARDGYAVELAQRRRGHNPTER